MDGTCEKEIKGIVEKIYPQLDGPQARHLGSEWAELPLPLYFTP